MVETWLGPDHPAVDVLIAERVRRYSDAVADGSTVPDDVRAAVRYAAGRCPIGVVSAAMTDEIEIVLQAAGLLELVSVVVSNGDVRNGKPHPEGYRQAVDRLGLAPAEVLAIEDTGPGLAAARAAGLRCAGVLGTQTAAELTGADVIVERLDVAAMEWLLTGSPPEVGR
jgi:beta-phosphoglucomutase-like phosphatase (HAD superfamily)